MAKGQGRTQLPKSKDSETKQGNLPERLHLIPNVTPAGPT